MNTYNESVKLYKCFLPARKRFATIDFIALPLAHATKQYEPTSSLVTLGMVRILSVSSTDGSRAIKALFGKTLSFLYQVIVRYPYV